VAGLTLNRDIAESYELPHQDGVLVVKVGRGSPADRAGVSAGDIILEADNKPLKTSEDLQHVVQDKKVGENLELSIARSQRQGKISVTLREITR
jgi:serine protease Do